MFSLSQKVANKWQYAKDREDLINRRFAPNDSTTIHLDDVNLDHNDRLHSSHRQIDDLLRSGSSIIGYDNFLLFVVSM